MKKNKLFILALVALPLLAGCSGETYYPSYSYPGDPFSEEGGHGGSGDSEDIEDEENMTVYFYLDYSHSDEPFFHMKWTMLKPLGSCPEGAVLQDSDAADPLYGKFLGYSEYSSAIDESLLWNFETDYKQSNILNLYGIWVSQ